MARQKREKSSIGVYHVLLRGEGPLFGAETDYEEFKKILCRYFGQELYSLYGYYLNDTVIHLIISEGEQELSKIMKPICTSYARYFNRTYKTTGKLFYDRYKSKALHCASDLMDAIVFINKKKGLTSVREYSKAEGICNVAEALEKAGGADAYKKRMKKPVSVMCLDDYDKMTEEETAWYIKELSGYDVQEIKDLDHMQQRQAMERIKAQKWISARRLSEILGIGKGVIDRAGSNPHRTTAKKEAPKEPVKEQPEEQPVQRRQSTELSFWLL